MEQNIYWYTRYYKGEIENPFDQEKEYWAYKYWLYEKDYFVQQSNPNEVDFKEYIIGVITHIADYFSAPFENHLKNYFGNK